MQYSQQVSNLIKDKSSESLGSYKLSVTVIGAPISDSSNVKFGMVIDFSDFKINGVISNSYFNRINARK